MLAKIGFVTFIVTLFCVILLRREIPSFGSFDPSWDLVWNVEISNVKVPVPIVTFLTALIVALLFRILRLHDRLSDLFGIRAAFDFAYIIQPLALLSGATVTAKRLRAMKDLRDDVMAATFYKYASSMDKDPVPGKHLIIMAMDDWSWYWIVLEVDTVLTITGTILLFSASYSWSSILFFVILITLPILMYIKYRCSRHALAEIATIAEEQDRREEIRKYFDAL